MNHDTLQEIPLLPEPANPGPRPYPETSLRLPGRWLVPARIAWLAIAGLCTGLYLASLSPLFTALQTPCVGAACLDWQLSPAQIQSLAGRGIGLRVYAIYFTTLGIGVALVYAATALFIFWRKPADGLALFGSLTLLLFGVPGMNDVAMAALVAVSPAWQIPVSGLIVLGDIGLLVFFCLFPNGQFVPHWTRWLALGWIAFRLPAILFPLSPFDTEAGPWAGLLWSLFLGGLIVAQVYRYRYVSNPTHRQQTKWIVFGLTLAIGGFLIVVFGLPLLSPSFHLDLSAPYTWVAITVIDLLWLLIPLSMALAILRYRLWDVDLIINRTLVYSALTASIAGLVTAQAYKPVAH